MGEEQEMEVRVEKSLPSVFPERGVHLTEAEVGRPRNLHVP